MKQKTKPIHPTEEQSPADDKNLSPASDPHPMTISIVRQFARVYHPDERYTPAFGSAIYIN